MGFSYRSDAGETLRTWQAFFEGQGQGSSNVYRGTDGETYFLETSRRETDDGGITGAVYQYVGEWDRGQRRCRQRGRFRIDGDGTVSRYPVAWPFAKDGKW